MIGAVMQLANETVNVIVDGNNVYFKDEIGNMVATIDGLKLSQRGVEKEHPDLKDDPEWRKKAIERFKDKIKSYETEDKAIKYIIDDLSKHGYVAKFIQRQGFRNKKC